MDELTNEEKERYEKETRYIRNMLRQIKKDYNKYKEYVME